MENKCLVTIDGIAVPTRHKEYWNPPPIQIPYTYVSVRGFPLITIEYVVELTAVGTGTKIELPIVLGNVVPSTREPLLPPSQGQATPGTDLMAYQPPLAGMQGGLPNVGLAQPPPPALNWQASVPHPYAPGPYPMGLPQQFGLEMVHPSASGKDSSLAPPSDAPPPPYAP